MTLLSRLNINRVEFILPCAVFILFSAVLMFSGNALGDPDTGWHIAAGQWMLEHHRLPYADVWSYTAGNTQWYNLSWLFDVVVAALHHVGGMELLYAITVITYPLLASVLARDALHAGGSVRMTFLFFLFIVMPLFTASALMRPQIVSMLMLYLFVRILARDAAHPAPARLAWLPVLMIVWVNSHGGFLIAPFVFAAFLFDAWWKKDTRRLWRIVLFGALTAAAILVNPYGWHIYDGVMRTLSSVLFDYIDEWQGADVFASYYLFAILGCLFGLRWKEAGATLPQHLLAVVLLLMMLDSARHGMSFSIVATPVLCAGLTHAFRESRWGEKAVEIEQCDRQQLTSPAIGRVMLALVCVVGAFIIIAPLRQVVLGEKAGAQYAETLPPAIAYAAEHYPDIRWMNHYNLGGWLIYYGADNKMLFVDGRTETAYPKAVMQDYLDFTAAEGGDARLQRIIEGYRISGIIATTSFEKDYTKAFAMNPAASGHDFAHKAQQMGWEEVYRNTDVVLFIRRP